MPEEQKDTQPTAQKEDMQVSSADLEGAGEIAAAADQLAAVTLADMVDSEAGVDELHDSFSDPELWKPHPQTEDCPVCLVPLSLDVNKSTYLPCCGKKICNACLRESDRVLRITNEKRKKKELPSLDMSCAFCREPNHKSHSELKARIEKRIAKGDFEAVAIFGMWCQRGLQGFPKDEAKALELFKKAADMGSAKGMCQLGHTYIMGTYGCPKNKKKGFRYFEAAAKKGHVPSRYCLGALPLQNDQLSSRSYHLAIKHLRLAAEAGEKHAVKVIWRAVSIGKLSKTDLEEILRAHQAARDEMDSEDRRRLEAYENALTGDDDILKGLYETYYEGIFNAKQLKEALKMHRNGSGLAEIQKFVAKCGTGK